jgi:hypothetical protein
LTVAVHQAQGELTVRFTGCSEAALAPADRHFNIGGMQIRGEGLLDEHVSAGICNRWLKAALTSIKIPFEAISAMAAGVW